MRKGAPLRPGIFPPILNGITVFAYVASCIGQARLGLAENDVGRITATTGLDPVPVGRRFGRRSDQQTQEHQQTRDLEEHGGSNRFMFLVFRLGRHGLPMSLGDDVVHACVRQRGWKACERHKLDSRQQAARPLRVVPARARRTGRLAERKPSRRGRPRVKAAVHEKTAGDRPRRFDLGERKIPTRDQPVQTLARRRRTIAPTKTSPPATMP